jgi:hypothetical protein
MRNTIIFSVADLPPQKDGANSMWGKASEMKRIKSLRSAAFRAMQNQPLARLWVHMELKIHAVPSDGDLDNFITGICDSLMAAHPRTPIGDGDWGDVDPGIKPSEAIVYKNDAIIKRITTERLPPGSFGKHYEVVLEFE